MNVQSKTTTTRTSNPILKPPQPLAPFFPTAVSNRLSHSCASLTSCFLRPLASSSPSVSTPSNFISTCVRIVSVNRLCSKSRFAISRGGLSTRSAAGGISVVSKLARIASSFPIGVVGCGAGCGLGCLEPARGGCGDGCRRCEE